MSPGFTLDAIRPLVADQRVVGRTVIVTFRCPASRRNVQARWTAPQAASVGSAVAAQAKKSAWYEARRQVNGMVRSVLGYGSMAQIATQVVNTAMNTVDPGGSTPSTAPLSTTDTQTGLLEAFKTVSSQFAWVGGRWVHTSAATSQMSPFEAQLATHPLTSAYDRQVLARMWIEVASAHGGLGEEEQLFLGESIAPDLGSLEALRRRPQLTAAEVGETSPGEARISLLATVWSAALCDEELAEEERAVLERYAQQLGLTRQQADRARDLARGYLVDQVLDRMFTWGEHDEAARDQLVALGARIGMSRAEVERAEAQFQKRRG